VQVVRAQGEAAEPMRAVGARAEADELLAVVQLEQLDDGVVAALERVVLDDDLLEEGGAPPRCRAFVHAWTLTVALRPNCTGIASKLNSAQLAADIGSVGKSLIGFGLFAGSIVGGFVPSLWGDNGMFSMAGMLFSVIGGVAGIWAGYRLSQNLDL
jgi:hypothetical protein